MGYGYGGPMGYGYGNMMYGWGGWIMWLIIIVVAVLVIYFLVVQSRNINPVRGQGGETPMDILKKRYARGEITKEEYENMKKDLM